MAYREFENERTYAAPDTTGFLSHTISTIHNQLAEKARQKKANLTAAQRFKMDVGKAAYTSDQDVLNENAKEITARAIHELKNNGQLSGETSLAMQDHQSMLQKSLIDKKLADQVRAKIKENADNPKNYYNGKVDEDALIKAEYDGPIGERQDRIQAVAKNLAGIDTFNKGKFVADHIQRQKLNKMQNVTDQSGIKTTKMTSAIFMKPDGTPGVTDSHVVEMFNEDPRVEQWYTKAVDKQLTDEVGRMKALGNDPRVSWMKGMSDEDIKAAIIENPALNMINGTPFGQRKKELARADLAVGQDLNRSTSVDYSDTAGATGGKFNNTKIGYQPTFVDQAINFKSLNGSKQAGTVGADLTYIDKGGPLKFITNSPIRANTGTGQVDTKASDNMEFNLRNYGLYAYDDKGQLYPLQGKSLDDLKASVDAIPDRYFTVNDPKNPHPLNLEMSIGLNGFAINKSKLINQSLEKKSELAEKYNAAVEAGDEIQINQIKNRMDAIDKLRNMASNGDVDDLDLLMSGKQLGISGVQNDMIVKAGDQDLAKLRTMTNGLDLRNQEKWTDDMRELNDYYKARAQKALQNPQSPAKPTSTKAKATTITPDEFSSKWASLKKGDKLVGPDGKTYTKN